MSAQHTNQTGMAMKVGYLVNTYPSPSHSFIRREVQALERQGVTIHRFAMRGMRPHLVDPDDIAEHDKTEHVLDSGLARVILTALAQIATAPRHSLVGLRRAIRLGRRQSGGLMRHLIYFVEACYLVRRCAAEELGHIHAHFGTNPASVANIMRAMGGPTYSFTVHGPEEFDAPRALGLDLKIADAAFTVAVSSFGRSQLCRWVDHKHWGRIKVVHCGIDPAKFANVAPMPVGPLRLVAIGRMVEQKGQMVLIDALAEIPHLNLHVTFVGDGPMRQQIEGALEANKLSGKVTLTGWVDEARVRAELANAHVLVMPSFAEGLPVVIMEAMAAGRPVIATYIAGTPELVQQGKNGWLVPAGSPSEMAQTILKVAALPVATLQEMGLSARTRALTRHDIDTEAGKLRAAFQEV
jgi:glycosyltransferase involved in cell wall biosynthesis